MSIYSTTWKETKKPRWLSALIIDDQSRVYMAGALTGKIHGDVMACAAWDSAPSVFYAKHRYYDADWLASNYPHIADVVEAGKRMAHRKIQTDDFRDWVNSP